MAGTGLGQDMCGQLDGEGEQAVPLAAAPKLAGIIYGADFLQVVLQGWGGRGRPRHWGKGVRFGHPTTQESRASQGVRRWYRSDLKMSFKKTHSGVFFPRILLFFFFFPLCKQIYLFCGARTKQAGPPLPPLPSVPCYFSGLRCYLRGLHKIKLRGFLILETHNTSLVNGNLKLSEAGWEMFKTKMQDPPGLF